jgi:hypothetical protein
MRWWLWSWAIGLALSSSACVPFLVPPARVESGIGTRVHPPKTPEGVEGSRATGVLRAGFHPLQLVGPGAPPWADFGFGYRSEWVLDDSEQPLHGPYAELGLYPVRSRLSNETRLRFGGYTSADALLTSAREPGYGATLGTLIEVTGFSSGAFGHSDGDDAVGGLSHGQWAVGLFANTSFRNADDRFSQTLSTGLSFRMPFVVGVACCAWPRGNWSLSELGSSTSDDSSEPRRSSKGSHRKRSEPEKRREYHPARPRRKNKD